MPTLPEHLNSRIVEHCADALHGKAHDEVFGAVGQKSQHALTMGDATSQQTVGDTPDRRRKRRMTHGQRAVFNEGMPRAQPRIALDGAQQRALADAVMHGDIPVGANSFPQSRSPMSD